MSEPASKDQGYTQFKQASKGPDFITFAERIPTLKYQHALVNCGRKLLHLILRTLILGDINDIVAIVKKTLKSEHHYQNSFTTEEKPILEKGNPKKWDICLLFKVIQKICGLEKIGDPCWKNNIDDKEPLEYLITTLKNQRNDAVHNFQVVITKDQLEEKLSELYDSAKRLVSALGRRAKMLKKELTVKESNDILILVQKIIANAKTLIKESSKSMPATSTLPSAVPESAEGENESDEEDDYVERMKYDRKEVSQEPSLKMFEKLQKEFWEYAGSVDDV